MARPDWTNHEKGAIEWSFRRSALAFCTQCRKQLEARRAGEGQDSGWVLTCLECAREMTIPAKPSANP